MARKEKTAEEYETRAHAHGYERGAHSEQDRIRNKNRLVPKTKAAQDKALQLYAKLVKS